MIYVRFLLCILEVNAYPEQDTSKLKKLVQGEFESLRSFVTRYHKEVTDLGAFDYPDALEGLKKGFRINRLWNSLYNKGYQHTLRRTIRQNYI